VSGRRLGTFVSGALLFGLLFLNLNPIASLPAPGRLLDPVRGIWSVTRSAELPDSARASIPGLIAPVEVHYDRRGVPHIFARHEADVMRSLGYVVARDRLFQMEVQARAGAGSLAEMVGAAALPLDREIRQLGLPDGARRSLDALEPHDRELLEAFSAGVNAWIVEHAARDMPFEYHLLGRRPRPWTPLHTLDLISRMGYVLALSDLEQTVEQARTLLGSTVADALYPRDNPIQEPVQPNGDRAPRMTSDVIPPPPDPGIAAGGGDIVRATRRVALRTATTQRVALAPSGMELRHQAGDALGSNNWAVAPSRTAAGHALLAGDQHLELTLPAIWYEVHLVVGDSLDVYGVTIPGAPGVIIGFNRAVAWTFTNTEADVLDLYQETVDDTIRPTRYLLDSTWTPLRVELETYRGARGERIGRDTLRYTHRGPLRKNPAGGGWVSLRWTVLESPSPPSIFLRAAREHDVTGWLATMAGYRAPAQNMLVVDTAGSIAIRSNGRFPVRPQGRGDLIQPGASHANDWTDEWSLHSMPQALNPARGFLSSANQQPIDPRSDSRYLGANWYSPWRAMRINQLLRADSSMTPEGMRRIQVDPGSALADLFVPALLNAASKFPERDSLRRAALLLAEWDRRYTVENTRAVLFEEAMSQVQLLLWDELHRPGSTLPDDPGLAVTAQLLRDSTNMWWDDRRTRPIETRDDLLALALTRALTATISAHGEPTGDNWRWDRIRTMNVRHLLRLPALSALGIPNAGGMSTINPLSGEGHFGSSWRMIVEAGPEMHGWGAYPGGQSGNPLSSRYLDRMRSWRAGELDSLRFPHRAAELDRERTSLLQLRPGAAP
jgi:penicillin amidase